MNRKPQHQVGDLRPSQLLLSFGVGATIKLPHLSTLVMGIDEWNTRQAEEIYEPRLLQAIQSIHSMRKVNRLLTPPLDATGQSSLAGVPVAAFPRWMVCPRCHLLASIDEGYFKLRANKYHPDRTGYVHENCRGVSQGTNWPLVVPSRFLIACKAGHLDDFPWYTFIHGSSKCRSELYMQEYGISGEPSDILIRCAACKAKPRLMADAFLSDESKEKERTFRPECSGRSPHLRTYAKKKCEQAARTTLLSASNTWFPLVYTSLAIPEAEDTLGEIVESLWSLLGSAEDVNDVKSYIKPHQYKIRLQDYSVEEIWQAIEQKQHGSTEPVRTIRPGDLKLPEWQVLTDPSHAPRTYDFELQPGEIPERYEKMIQQVVLVERLREVRTLTGFTRIESLSDYADEEELPWDHIMRLSLHEPDWLPATEVRGEGIFIQFREEAIQRWLQKVPVQRHNDLFYSAHKRWRKDRKLVDPAANYPTIRYILLHTFAHALIRQLALACGYSAASIRERIYSQSPQANDGAMAGILLYTAASDSEGTLGGLVNQGKAHELGYHIDNLLDDMEYCTSDPLCAEHVSLEGNKLHGAACHSCMFIPETSCERGNRYLDRSLLMATVERGDLAFFEGITDNQDNEKNTIYTP